MPPTTAGPSLIDAYDAVVCDLDGVVYRGAEAVSGAPASLQELVTRGVGLVYATNNASRVPAEVARHLSGLGAPSSEADVVSSAQAGAGRLASDLRPGAQVLALGGPGVAEALRGVGLVPVRPVDVDFGSAPGTESPEASSARDVAAVLQGFGRDLTVGDFEVAARLLSLGARWVGSNDDATLPLPWGQAPGNGAYIDLLAKAAGRRPDVVGKPHPPLYRLALDRLGSAARRTLAVGDRLATDIAGAQAAGLDSAWVLTGVDHPSDLLATEASPTYVIASLDELLQPYAVPDRRTDGWRCGSAEVAYADGRLVVGREGDHPVETVRAGLAALLEAREAGTPAAGLAQEARVLDEMLEPLLAATLEEQPAPNR